MINQTNPSLSEAVERVWKRLRDEASRRNSAYDRFDMDNTPQSVDPDVFIILQSLSVEEEVIARALCEHDGHDADDLVPGDDPYMDDIPRIDGYSRNDDACHFRWRGYVLQARAVLDTLGMAK
jgi:hypothetical protein